ncbi:MAG: hypothetical protein HFJ02_01510 [Bacilli bacterium]|nr:hypothetical protein [Bacilli bacterium]
MDAVIDEKIDKTLFYKKLSTDRVVNLTGEGGSGKSTISTNYKNDDNYIVVDYDLIVLNPQVGTIEYELKQMLMKKYGNSLFESANKIGMDRIKENFTTMYNEIISFLSPRGKTIVLDGSQLRFIKDAKEIKGEFIALRPSLQTCISQFLKRFREKNPNATEQETQKYMQSRTDILYKLNPVLNDLLVQVDKMPDVRHADQQIDSNQIQAYLNEKAIEYLKIIQNEYGKFMSEEQINFMEQLLSSNNVIVEQNGNAYINNQQNDIINNDNTLTDFQKIEEMRKLNIPLAHGGRVFEDNIIHFYPSILKVKNPQLTTDELKQKCDEILVHELLHYFIRPKSLDINNPELKGINSFTTEGLVDMCARDINQKYRLFPSYNSEYGTNVIFMRKALSNIQNISERMQLVFNGSVSQIYQQTTTQKYNTQKEFVSARDKKTKFDAFITNISNICFTEKKQVESAQRFLYNFSANFKSKNESLDAIERMSQQQFSDKVPLIQQQTNAYRINNESKTQTTASQLTETITRDQKKPFDQRSQSEIQVAQQIRIKNQSIAEQKQQQKQVDKPKMLVKMNPNVSTSNKGYIDIIILAFVISFVASMLSMIIYSIIK